MPEKIGPYTIVSQLGRGGMGVVYKGRDEALNRFVAIKVLTENLSDDPTFLQRFVREAQAAAALSHPNVVQIYSTGEDESGHPYFVMEYVSGTSLDHLLRSEGRVNNPRASQMILQAAQGLAAAYDLGIVHRDIKPANLILDERGIVKIADFGLALAADAEHRLTATGMLVGTPGYLSPEQCAGEKADHRSDIYALGVTYYMLLTGTPPFRGESPLALLKQILDANPPDVASLNPTVEAESRRILAKMIAKDRDQRYQNCHDLVADLETFLGTSGVRSATAGLASRSSRATPADLAVMTAPTTLVATQEASAASPAPPSILAVPPPPPAATSASASSAVTLPETPMLAAPTQPSIAPPAAKKGVSARSILIAAVLAFVLLGGGAVAAVLYGAKLFRGAVSAGSQQAEVDAKGSTPEAIPSPDVLLSQPVTAPAFAATETLPDRTSGEADAVTAKAVGTQPVAQASMTGSTAPASAATGQQASSARGREAASAPIAPAAREPQRRARSGVAIAAIGDPALLGAVSSVLRRQAAEAGLEAVDAHSLPSTDELLQGRASLRELLARLRDDGYGVLMLARIEPTGQRELSFYGRRDTAYSARITVTAYDLATGRPFGTPQDGEIEYTSINVSTESQDVVTPLARAVAEEIRRR
jgi:eukaryotic-like serine/threonine-protein kinase